MTDNEYKEEIIDNFKKTMGCTPQEWLHKRIDDTINKQFEYHYYKSNVEILPVLNVEQVELFGKNLGYKKEEWNDKNFIFHIMKQYNDFNVNNYIICYIYVEFDNKPFDEKLYNEYHEEYLKYYSKNSDTKIIVWTNNFNWCKLNFKFFNTAYIYFNTIYEKILK
jgi:hypothetical protein